MPTSAIRVPLRNGCKLRLSSTCLRSIPGRSRMAVRLNCALVISSSSTSTSSASAARAIDLQIELRAAVREELALGVPIHGDGLHGGETATSVIETVAAAAIGAIRAVRIERDIPLSSRARVGLGRARAGCLAASRHRRP